MRKEPLPKNDCIIRWLDECRCKSFEGFYGKLCSIHFLPIYCGGLAEGGMQSEIAEINGTR